MIVIMKIKEYMSLKDDRIYKQRALKYRRVWILKHFHVTLKKLSATVFAISQMGELS